MGDLTSKVVDSLTAEVVDHLTAKLVNHLTSMLVNHFTAKLMNLLTAKLMGCLTAKLMVVNEVKLHLTKLRTYYYCYSYPISLCNHLSKSFPLLSNINLAKHIVTWFGLKNKGGPSPGSTTVILTHKNIMVCYPQLVTKATFMKRTSCL